jgi:DNA-binding NtrC family response regulator
MVPLVLIVDDDAEILHLTRHALRREPYQVVVADEGMPGMSGTELLAQVQLEYPETIRMMLTGQSSLDVAMRAINEGQVYRFLLKPVRAAELGAAIRDAIREWDNRGVVRPGPLHTRRQEVELAEIESEWQGLTHVERDDSGAIVVLEEDADLERTLREVEAQTQTRARR